MNPTPGQIQSIRTFVGSMAAGWSNTDAQIRQAMAAATVANPVAQATIARPFAAADLVNACSQGNRGALAPLLAGSAAALILGQDIGHLSAGLDAMAAIGSISDADAAAMKAVMTATQPDPAWEAIERAFRELPAKLAKKVIRQGLRAGAKIVQSDAQAKAPEDTGRTRKAIKVRASKSRKKNVIAMGVVIGKGDYQGETFYGAFQEYGWKTGSRKSKSRRQVPGKHFMRRALEQKRAQAQAAIADVIAYGIELEASKASGVASFLASVKADSAPAPGVTGAASKPARAGRDERGRFAAAR